MATHPRARGALLSFALVLLLDWALISQTGSTRLGTGLFCFAGVVALGATAAMLPEVATTAVGRLWLVVVQIVVLAVAAFGVPWLFLAALITDVVYVMGVRPLLKKPTDAAAPDSAAQP